MPMVGKGFGSAPKGPEPFLVWTSPSPSLAFGTSSSGTHSASPGTWGGGLRSHHQDQALGRDLEQRPQRHRVNRNPIRLGLVGSGIAHLHHLSVLRVENVLNVQP